MGRCVVIGGADIADYDRIAGFLRADDFLIFCDSGLKHMDKLGRKADLIVGDFDSYPDPRKGVSPLSGELPEVIALPREKDDTDTAFAVKEGLRRGFEEFVLVGAIGERFDHSLGNVQLLYMLDRLGKKAVLLDDYSEIEVVSDMATVSDEYPYFSLLCISEKAEGVTITGAKYGLDDAGLDCDFPLGVSNEPLPGKTAEITVKKGRLLLVRVIDKNRSV